ncbi:hypothetical protein IscW_ISCW014471 [Ixodes scapularis]|uniref:Uncharacterized protein n=1 Tax=Ixodes scapularis TaxID=6945 RepID=B7QIB1_IXOSC|nr:hypothetical protein IscW_ISCW014471 [Ixodes scapularis]|eukprot:XP_002414918.1 hypothetical protein IscW_ISCW014471 [Ixodes scapularis]
MSLYLEAFPIPVSVTNMKEKVTPMSYDSLKNNNVRLLFAWRSCAIFDIKFFFIYIHSFVACICHSCGEFCKGRGVMLGSPILFIIVSLFQFSSVASTNRCFGS